MMSSINERLLQRIQDLIEKGEGIKTCRYVERPSALAAISRHRLRDTPRGEYEPHVDSAQFEEWRTDALFLIQDINQSDSLYSTNFEEKVRSACVGDVDKGIGILRALKNAVEQGYLTRFRTLVAAGIFRDFLEMAEYLLESEYEDAVAPLVGAVLEQGLRQMCVKCDIPVKKDDGISSLNDKLAKKKVYGTYAHGQVQAWKRIRNKADHGEFDEYRKQDVEDMLKGVRRFLDENLK